MLDTLISCDPYSQMDFEAVHEEHLDYYLTHDEEKVEVCYIDANVGLYPKLIAIVAHIKVDRYFQPLIEPIILQNLTFYITSISLSSKFKNLFYKIKNKQIYLNL